MSEASGPMLAGRYRLLGQLGQGGMARVMRAHDTQLGRDVAIKLMNRELLGHAHSRERFSREAIFQARMDHPHVVRIYDFDLEGEAPYLAMEYVVGQDLDQLVRRDGPMPVERLTRLAREVGSAVDALHHAGMVHRDLKPANVMIRDRDGSAVVMDLGLVRTEDMSTLTDTGAMVGSPRYMPPEALREGSWTPAGDRWALGAILFEAATSLFLVSGRDLQDMIKNAATARYTPFPSTVLLPPPVKAALARAVSPQPGRRFPRAVDLAAALVGDEAGEPPGVGGLRAGVLASSPGGAQRADAPSAAALAHLASASGEAASVDRETPTGPASRPGSEPGKGAESTEHLVVPPPPERWSLAGRVGLAAVMALAFALGLTGLSGKRRPEAIQWSVVGDAAVVRCRPAGARGLALVAGTRRVEAGEADAEKDLRLVLPHLPEEGARVRLVWEGGESPAIRLRPEPPAIREGIRLGPGGSLTLEVLRPCRAGVEPAVELLALEPGTARIPPPPAESRPVLTWEERGVRFRRPLAIRGLEQETLEHLRRQVGARDMHRASRRLADGQEPSPAAASGQAWRSIWGLVPRLLGGAAPRPARAWLLEALEGWQRFRAVAAATGGIPWPRLPAGEPGHRGEELPAWAAIQRLLAIRPVDGSGHDPARGLYLLGCAGDLRVAMSGKPASALLVTWPADLPADTRRAAVGIRQQSLQGGLALRLQGRDRDGEPVELHLWRTDPGMLDHESIHQGWSVLCLPADLGPAPGSEVQIELVPLLLAYGNRNPIFEVRVLWETSGP